MGLLSSLRDAFKGKASQKKLDVRQRFKVSGRAVNGGMSQFHLVQDKTTGDKFGLKLLDESKTTQFRKRFKENPFPSEGEIGLTIKGPYICETIETGHTTDGLEYILVEFIAGARLDRAIQKHPAEVAKRAIRLMPQMIRAVQTVHDGEYIHRDICPRNFICDDKLETVKLIDFGLTLPNLPPFRLPKNRRGTPLYMAPEIVRRRPTDHRVDIFALGVTFYQMLASVHPWGVDENSGKTALTFDTMPSTDIRKHVPGIDEKLAVAIHKCIEPIPQNRYDHLKTILRIVREL